MFRLRKIDLQRDLHQVYVMLSKECNNISIPGFTGIISESQFHNRIVSMLHGFYHDCYVAVDEKDSVCGFFVSYDFRIVDSHCKIYAVMPLSFDKEMFGEFIHRLFVEYPLRKIFVEVGENEKELLQTADYFGFKREAVLIKSRFIDGIFYDTVISSIYAKDVLRRYNNE